MNNKSDKARQENQATIQNGGLDGALAVWRQVCTSAQPAIDHNSLLAVHGPYTAVKDLRCLCCW